MDISWCPYISHIFASVAKDGRLELWDLEHNTMDSCIDVKPGPDVLRSDPYLTFLGRMAGEKCPQVLIG
jgi:hypothetical protein